MTWRETWREIRGAYGRRRRALRRAMLEPVLVGWPVLRDTVMQALAAKTTTPEELAEIRKLLNKPRGEE